MPPRRCLAFATHPAVHAALSRVAAPLRSSFAFHNPLHRRVLLEPPCPRLPLRPIPAPAPRRLATHASAAVPPPTAPDPPPASAAPPPSAVDSDNAPDPATGVGYDFASFEQKWQARWATRRDFTVPQPPELDTSKPKYYVLDMFPYPSGSGLHVGHPEGYTATDILARFHRMRGYNVMHPMGWDAFGLPAEQFALATGTHPADTTDANIARFRDQLQALGFSYDWTREVRTSDPAYYRWTQWIFLQLWRRGLAYQDDKPVNWCPALGTVLANEEVIDGLSERGGHPVERRQMRQWVLRITAYAERLLTDLDDVDWPENVKEMQRNWIGRSEGAELTFSPVDRPGAQDIVVFTTRPETVCGASYVVVGPEWPGLPSVVAPERKAEVDAYVEAAARKSDRERTGEGVKAEKTGVWTGSYARNPITGEQVPVWVGDYVLGGYGTGAVMAVPAHDERDFEFAAAFDLPVVQVVEGDLAAGAITADNAVINWNGASGVDLDGLRASAARAKLLDHLEATGLGVRKVNYKLRDWLFSRQRYWGEPFPIVFVDGEPQAVDEADLPVTLPQVESYKPSGTGDSPLAAVDEWVNATHGPDGAAARRETNTMPQWAGSCWYYLRFLDPDNVGQPIDPAVEKYWMPVDMYVGGVEHAVLHLLYARFWHKVLYDVGVVSTKEPFQRLVNQGMILGEVEHTAFRDALGAWVSAKDVDVAACVRLSDGKPVTPERVGLDAVVKKGEFMELRDAPGVRVSSRAHKMSKSRGNVVNPDAVIEQYGADALRCYLMFMGPLEQVKPWGTKGVQGMSRFLARFWRLVVDPVTGGMCDAAAQGAGAEATREQLRTLNQTIRRVTEDVEALRFNTAIAALMEFVNAATKWDSRPVDAVLLPAVRMLSVFAPHMAEELWERLGQTAPLAHEAWPQWTDAYDEEESRLIVVQVNGKVRGKMQVPSSATKDEILRQALEQQGVLKHTNGKTIRKEIYVPNKLVNLVVSK